MTLQEHINEHNKPENEHIKSIYADESVTEDGVLPAYYNLRLNGCKIGKLTATKENVIHFNEGSIDNLEMTHGVVYFDGVDEIKNITATDSRIRISNSIKNEGKKTKIHNLNLTRCELDVLNSEFCGDEMLKSIKDCRVNVYKSDVNCSKGGKLDGRNFNMVKCEVVLQTKGWDFNNIHAQYTSTNITMNGSIPLHQITSSYIGLSKVIIKSQKVQFVGSKYSVCANDSQFLGGCRTFEVNDSGNINIENCKLENLICVKLKGSACSVLWSGGSGKGKEIGVDLEDNASACLLNLDFLEGGQIGINAKSKSWVCAENINSVKGGQYACKATGFSAMELLSCNYSAPVAFCGEEGTFVVRGDSTQISAGTTAQGSGTFVIDDGDGTYF